MCCQVDQGIDYFYNFYREKQLLGGREAGQGRGSWASQADEHSGPRPGQAREPEAHCDHRRYTTHCRMCWTSGQPSTESSRKDLGP